MAFNAPMNQPTTAMHKDSELIDKLGGPAEVARKLGFEMPKGIQRVQNWKYRGIPPLHEGHSNRRVRCRAQAPPPGLT